MKATVLTGGTSEERDVALASAAQVIGALRHRGHEVAVVDTASGLVEPDQESALLAGQVGVAPPSPEALRTGEREFLASGLGALAEIREADVVFLALHGGWGEDGTIQALLEVVGVPYIGSGPLASALAMDKDLSKRLFRFAGVAVAEWLMTPCTRQEVDRQLGWPVIVKPSRQGSTVGLSLVERPADLAAAVTLAECYDDEVMVEAFVPGRELTVSVLAGRALAVGEIKPAHELFDYECKYTPGMSEEVFPADVSDRVADEAQRLALAAHDCLGLGGYSRVDFRLTPAGELICLEANTLPGLAPTSLMPQAALASGIEFADLCEELCSLARVACRGNLS